MRKLPLLTILTMLLCAIGVYAEASFEIIEDSVDLSGTHAKTLSGSFTIDNTGTEDLAIDFTSSTLTDGGDPLAISGLSNIGNIASGSSETVSFSVAIPDKQKPGSYTGTITAESGALSDTITINVDVTPSYTVSTDPASQMNLGSAGLNSTHTETFDITNTGNEDITNIHFEFSDADFNFQADKSDFTLAVDATETIEFNITIPADFSTGNVTLGSVEIASTELNIDLFDVKAEVGGGLEIEDLDVFLTTRIKRKSDGTFGSDTGNDLDVYDTKKLNFDDEDVGPGSELRFNFNIENTFTDKEDVDINDITIKVTIEDIDDGSDIEEESEEFDLRSEETNDIDVYVNIPLSVDVGVYDVIIEVLGEDDNKNEHTAQMNLRLDIDKENTDIIITKASLVPEKIKCAGSSVLTTTIKNLGKRTEDDVKLEIINNDLNINSVQRNIKLVEDPFDDDNEFTKKLTINVDRNTKAGTYPISVKLYIREGILWETTTANLVVEACSGQIQEEEEQEEETEEEEEVEEVDETQVVGVGEETEEETIEGEEIPVLEPVTTTEVPFTKRPAFWFILIVLNVIVITGLGFLVVKLIK